MDPTAWRPRRGTRFVLVAVLLAALFGIVGGARAMTDGAGAPPTITSDQADYSPGSTVTLTGAYWQPGESVHLFVNDDAGQTWSHSADVSAAADGTITDRFQLPDWFVAVYSVTATGSASGTVTSSFTDAANPVVTIDSVSDTLLNASQSADVTWHADQSGTYSIRMGGNSCTNGGQLASGAYTTPGTVTTTISANSLAEGSNTIRVCVTNGSGGSGSKTTTITKDTQAPAVTINSVSKTLLGPSDTSVNVVWHAGESGSYSVRLGGTDCAGGTQVASGSYTSGNVTTAVNASSLSEGANTIRVCVTDAAGNPGFATTSVTKDTTAPVVTIDSVSKALLGPSDTSTGVTWHAGE